MKLLAEVLRLVRERGFAPVNVSISVLAERPRLSGYIEAMQQNLADVLKIPVHAVGIAAGTNEHLSLIHIFFDELGELLHRFGIGDRTAAQEMCIRDRACTR